MLNDNSVIVFQSLTFNYYKINIILTNIYQTCTWYFTVLPSWIERAQEVNLPSFGSGLVPVAEYYPNRVSADFLYSSYSYTTI